MHKKFEGLCWTKRPRARTSVCLQRQRSLRGVGRRKPGLLVREGPDSRRRAHLVTAVGQRCSSAGHGLCELAVHQSQDCDHLLWVLNWIRHLLHSSTHALVVSVPMSWACGQIRAKGTSCVLCDAKRQSRGFPGDSVEKKPACQRRRHDLDAWAGRISHAAEQLSLVQRNCCEPVL